MSEYNPDYWDDDDLFYPWDDLDEVVYRHIEQLDKMESEAAAQYWDDERREDDRT